MIGGIVGYAWPAPVHPTTWTDTRTWLGFAVAVIGVTIALVVDGRPRELDKWERTLDGSGELFPYHVVYDRATQRSNATTREDRGRSRVKKVIAWSRNNGAVSLIAGIALVLGAAVVTVAIVKHQSGDSVYLGLTLVVSVAILLAAVAAAIYAKPAYDEVVAQRLPPKLEISDITLLDAESKRLTAVGVASSLTNQSGDPIEKYETWAGSTIHLQVSITNAGKSSARFIFNCHVPAACTIRPTDHAGLAHYPAVPELYSLTADEELCNWTTARLDLPPDLTVTFHLDISLPDEAREGDDGWPMDVLVSGERDWRRSVQDKTWFVYAIDSPATDC
jgi:hypothetical protein